MGCLREVIIMAGKLCFGEVRNNAGSIKDSKAFCEGRFYRGQGTAIAFPITGNPHEAGSDSAISWDLGWTDVNAQAGSYADEVGCCAAVGDVLA